MPQPIVKKYKQGELGMPYPKKKNKNNLNLSAYGGEADPEIATKIIQANQTIMCNLHFGRKQMKKIIRRKNATTNYEKIQTRRNGYGIWYAIKRKTTG